MGKAVIVSACRTRVGRFLGSLKGIGATELGALVVKEAVARAEIRPDDVEEVIMGNVLSAGLGQKPAPPAAPPTPGPGEGPPLPPKPALWGPPPARGSSRGAGKDNP